MLELFHVPAKGGPRMDSYCFSFRNAAGDCSIALGAYDIREMNGYFFNWHPEMELTTLLHGQAEFTIGGELHTLGEDDVVLIDSNVGHMLHGDRTGNIGMTVRFSPDAVREYMRSDKKIILDCASDGTNRSGDAFREIRYYVARMMRAFLEERGMPFTLIGAYYSLLGVLVSNFGRTADQVAESVRRSDNQEIVKDIINFLEENYMRKISLDEISQRLKYNRTYCSLFFKRNVGINFFDYLARIRFRHAFHALNTTSKSLTSIAVDNGFSDLKTFSSYFKKMLQQTPSRYRRELDQKGKAGFAGKSRMYASIGEHGIEEKLDEYLREDASGGTGGADRRLLDDEAAGMRRRLAEIDALCGKIRNIAGGARER